MPSRDISQELKAIYPNIDEFSINKTILENLSEDSHDTLTIATIHLKRWLGKHDKTKIKDWLSIRSKADSLKVIWY